MADSQKSLEILQDAGLIRLAQLEPELEYLFRHELLRDVAYESILKHNRRVLHRAAGEAIERLYHDRIDELAPVLAYHFDQADEALLALKYATLAGDAARGKFANAEAVVHYSRALDIARRHDQSEPLEYLFRQLGHALEQTGRHPEALTTYEEMRSLARQHGDRPMELEAVLLLLTLRATPTPLFDIPIAHQLGDEALAQARALGNRTAESAALWNLSMLHSHQGEYEQAISYGEQSIAIARDLGVKERIAYGLNDLASFTYINARQAERGREALLEARQLWIELDNPGMLADSLSTLARYDTAMGNFEEALVESKEALQIAESIDNPWGRSYSRFATGGLYFARGEVDQALQTYEQCFEWAEKAGFMAALVGPQSDYAVMLGLLGQTGRGLQLVQRALETTGVGLVTWRAWPLGNLARLHILTGDLKSAGEAVQEMATLRGTSFLEASAANDLPTVEYQLASGKFAQAEQQAEAMIDYLRAGGAFRFLPGMLLAKARALVGLGRQDEAIGPLEEALERAQRMTTRWELWQCLALLADIKGDSLLREQARQHVAFIADHIGDADLRGSFLSLPPVKKLT